MSTLIQDLKYGLRMLAKNSGFTAVAVLTLALGIGANTAIFSLIDAVLLRGLPVKNPRQLVVLGWHQTRKVQGGPGFSGDGTHSLPYLGFQRLRRHYDVFSNVVGFVPLGTGPESVTVNIDGHASVAGGEMVSGNYFAGLGVSPVLGRVLTDADEDRAARVAVLSYGYWNRKFGRDPAVIGKTITLGGEPFSIVGVAPPEFFGVQRRLGVRLLGSLDGLAQPRSIGRLVARCFHYHARVVVAHDRWAPQTRGKLVAGPGSGRCLAAAMPHR